MIHLPCLGGGYTIVEAIMGLAAYEDGATDSGIRDEVLRAKVEAYINGLSREQYRKLRAMVAREFLDDEAVEQGYGMESAREVDDWIEERRHVW